MVLSWAFLPISPPRRWVVDSEEKITIQSHANIIKLDDMIKSSNAAGVVFRKSIYKPNVTALSPAATANATLYPKSQGRPSSGGHHPRLTAIGGPTYGTTRGRRTLAAISPDHPYCLHPPCGELGARWQLHGSANIDPWA